MAYHIWDSAFQVSSEAVHEFGGILISEHANTIAKALYGCDDLDKAIEIASQLFPDTDDRNKGTAKERVLKKLEALKEAVL